MARLTKTEQDEIVAGLRAGRSCYAIAQELGRDESVIRRAAARPEIRKRVRRSEQNARAYERRMAAAEPKSRDDAAADATATRQRRSGGDGKLLGVFGIGGTADGRYRPMSNARRAELLDERDRDRETSAALLREGWLICDATGILYLKGTIPNPPHAPLSRDAHRSELLRMVDSGWTPAPEHAALVEREVAILREVESRLQEQLDDMSPRDRDALLPLDVWNLRQSIRAEVMP